MEPRVVTENLQYHDRKFFHFYLAFTVVYLIVGAVGYSLSADNIAELHDLIEENGGGAIGLAVQALGTVAPYLLISVLVALGAGFLWFTLLKNFPVFMTWTSLLFWPAAAVLGFLAIIGGPSDGDEDVDITGPIVGMLFMAGIPLAIIFCFRDRIRLATQVLTEAMNVLDKVPSVFGYSLGIVFAYLPFAFLSGWFTYRVVLAGELREIPGVDDDHPDYKWVEHPLTRPLSAVIAFHLYWTSSFVTYVQTATIAGVVGTHYFHGNDASAMENVTRKSLARALTTSLGSLFYGALISAVVQMIRNAMNQQKRGRRSNMATLILVIMIKCVLSCILAWIEFFTKYTAIHVALSGQNFCDSAKSTFEMLKRNLVSTVVVDRIVGMVLGGGAFIMAVAVAIFLGTTSSSLMSETDDVVAIVITVVVASVGFLLSIITLSFIIRVIETAANTVFVCYTIDKDNAIQTNPHIHNTYDGFAQIDEDKAAKLYPSYN